MSPLFLSILIHYINICVFLCYNGADIEHTLEHRDAKGPPIALPSSMLQGVFGGQKIGSFPLIKTNLQIQPPASERNRMDKTPLNDDLMRKILHDHIRQMVEYRAILKHKKLWRDYSPTERLQRMLEEAISMIAEEIMKGRKENGE